MSTFIKIVLQIGRWLKPRVVDDLLGECTLCREHRLLPKVIGFIHVSESEFAVS